MGFLSSNNNNNNNNAHSSSSSSSSTAQTKIMIIDELVQGRDLANQLHTLLATASDYQNDTVSAEDLLTKIMDSFTNTLLMLKKNNTVISTAADATDDEIYDVDSKIQRSKTTALEGRIIKSDYEDSQESTISMTNSVISSNTTTNHHHHHHQQHLIKDRRGSYKRRKTCHTMKKETSTLIDDGHAWRKYGQKIILNAKYPRNYFRCTHKYDQGCQATKQVQKIEDEMYRTTYYGEHTCSSLNNNKLLGSHHDLILDCPSSPSNTSVLLSFNNNNSKQQQITHPFFSNHHSLKQEDDRFTINDDNNNTNNNQTSSSDYNNNHHQTRDDHHFDHDDLMMSMINDDHHRSSPALESDDDHHHHGHHHINGDVMIGMDLFDDVLSSFQF
ncbi:hypothetical protein F8388_008334 [Cannabis sativa]|uniref:WRKY domain-containing protein n=1 Tax=Cannabis sativa TaxID=3483 RepID=A0A7J6GME7_CANSA|nr:hypothetical protein F8388_008334 [Cannabis sativa]KAF4383958.1 hypothetical protein G4B88_016391 [Cannabis sativa]